MIDKKWDIKRGYSVYKSVYTPVLKKWIKEGKINKGEVLVWTSGMSSWRSPEDLIEFGSLFKKKKTRAIFTRIQKRAKKKKRLSILIIDDEKDICWLLEKYLKKRHFDVFSANTGRSGIELVKEKRPNIVLLDLKLEDIDGLKILRRIKKVSGETKVIIVSAFADSIIKESARHLGADGFVDKPFNPEEIVKAIRKV